MQQLGMVPLFNVAVAAILSPTVVFEVLLVFTVYSSYRPVLPSAIFQLVFIE